MRFERMVSTGIAALIVACAGGAPAAADPTGLWRANDGGTTRIARCGSAFCGTIASTVPTNATDEKNTDSSKRNRPLVGVMVLISMQQSGSNRWSGRLYNPHDGQFYPGHLIEQGDSTIRVEGCGFLGMCGGENLTRVR